MPEGFGRVCYELVAQRQYYQVVKCCPYLIFCGGFASNIFGF